MIMVRLLFTFITCALCAMVHAQPSYAREIGSTLVSHRNDGYQYGRVPSNQFGTSIAIAAQVLNTGTEPQTNLVLNIAVTAPGSANTFSLVQAHPLLDPGASVTMEQLPAISGMEAGNYSVDYSIASDQDPFEANTANDSTTRHFSVDSDWFTLDGFGVHAAADIDTASIGTDSYPGGEDHMTCLTKYRVTNPLRVLGIEVLLGNNTVPGGYVIGALYDTTGVLVGDLSQPLWESNPEDIDPLAISWGSRYVQVDELYVLNAGAYYAAATMYSAGGASPLRLMDDRTVEQPDDASLVHVPGAGTLTDGNAFAIRLHVAMINAVTEPADPARFTLYPNPTNGIVTFRSEEHGICGIEVMDPTGRSVLHTNASDGKTIDLRGQAKGLYVVHVTSGNTSSRHRVVLE